MSAARFSRYLLIFSGIQKPERSILPEDVRTGAAFRSTLPSAVRGTCFHGYGSHCALATLATANIAKATNGMQWVFLVRIIPLDWFSINLDPGYVGVSARTMAASRSEIGKADRVDLAEIHYVQQGPLGLHLGHIELEPAHFGQIEFALVL